jgi:hypothetical protein
MAQPSGFTCENIGGEANDAIKRIGLVHDIMSHYAKDVAFVLPDYLNYHCPGLDFLDLFGIRDFPHHTEPSRYSRRIEMRSSELLEDIWNHRLNVQPGVLYVVKPDIQHGPKNRNKLIDALIERDGFEETFRTKLRYLPKSNPFSLQPDSWKITLHMRRNDICGGFLFEDISTKNPVPSCPLVSRPLMHISEATSLIEEVVPPASRVEVFIASDGVERLRTIYRHHPDVIAQLDLLDEELHQAPQSPHLDITVVGRQIGTDPDTTRKTLDAMYHSDFVISKSSGFPGLFRGFGNFDVLNGNKRISMRDNINLRNVVT